MLIELRRFKAYPARSEETLNFTADVYVDGKRAGTVDNDGHGGMNRLDFFSPQVREAVRAYCVALPPEPSEHGPIPMTVDFFFSTLAEKLALAADEAKAQRRINRFAMDARVKGLFPFEGRFIGQHGQEVEVLLSSLTDNLEAARAEVEKMAARKKGRVLRVSRLGVAQAK